MAIFVVFAAKMVVWWLLGLEAVSVSREFDDDRYGGRGSVRGSKLLR